MPSNLENSAMAQDWKRLVFIPISKQDNAPTTAQLHSKILQARLQQYINRELQIFKLDLEKTEKPEVKLPIFAGS